MRGDAFDLPTRLGDGDTQFAAIVSGLPLLTHTMMERLALLAIAMHHLKPGASYVQFSYGTRPPIEPAAGWNRTEARSCWY